MNFETPLTRLVWLTSIVSVALTYVVSYWLIPNLGGDPILWWKLSTVITCGTLAGAIIPELVKIFTSTESGHVQRGGDLVARGRRVAQHPLRASSPATSAPTGWASRILGADGDRLRRQHPGAGRADDCPGGLRVRPRGVRVPRHGAGDDRRRLLRPGHRQRAVGLRALDHRIDTEHQGRSSRRTSAST